MSSPSMDSTSPSICSDASETSPVRRGCDVRRRFVFGLTAQSEVGRSNASAIALERWFREVANIDVERREVDSYEALADEVRAGRVDVAWLPPIAFLRLDEEARPVGNILRDGKSGYEAALVVRADSHARSIEALHGTRAGWVDRWSAAGFVLPRVKLALAGLDPRSCFRTERFHGSHRAALQALVDGACDVVGTYARSGQNGGATSGAWSEMGADVRVLATFGAIPPDVIAVRRGMNAEDLDAFSHAIEGAFGSADAKPILRDLFGGDEFRSGLAPGYDALRSALVSASECGLFD